MLYGQKGGSSASFSQTKPRSRVNSSFLRFNVCIQMKGGSSPPVRCN